MKGITKILFGLSCLCCVNLAHGQERPKSGNEHEAETQSGTNLIVCKLQGPELTKRKVALQKEIFSQVIRTEEKEDGFLFSFEDRGDFLSKLVDYMLSEQKCCPFFQFDLSIKANHGGIGLKVSGSPEVKEFLGAMLEE